MKYDNVLQTIGNTPHIRMNYLFPRTHEVWMKAEKFNPGGSIKDRIALQMVEDAEQKGVISQKTTIIEATSGNTGIGLAMVAAVKKYKLILVMPDSMSVERRKLMEVYGATFVLTPRSEGMRGAITKAREIMQATPNSWIPSQFDNPANVAAHVQHTAREILADFPEGFDYLITGVGTGGHISGVSQVLKEKFPHLKTIAVEPEASPVMSGGKAGPHPLQGIGAGFIPRNVYQYLLDEVITISQTEAFDYARRVAQQEGIFVGISSGAALAAVAKKIPDIPAGSRILTFSYDTGERYLSVENLF